jgi:AraC family transcriptional regulator of adaptative response/methylated-DNA-[protein]-cysteine methyltransferase
MDLWLAPHDARVRGIRELQFGFHSSPFGDCAALTTDDHLVALRFLGDREDGAGAFEKEWPGVTLRLSEQAGDVARRAFEQPEEVPLLAIGTPFQLLVWEYLRHRISAVTMTYGEVARAVGRPTAARAVGRAVGANGIAVLIPCHRVVSRGKLTGYRWGLDRKKALLSWELSRRDPLRMPF